MLPPDGGAGAAGVAAAATRARAGERPSGRARTRVETVSVAKFEVDDEIDTTPRDETPPQAWPWRRATSSTRSRSRPSRLRRDETPRALGARAAATMRTRG